MHPAPAFTRSAFTVLSAVIDSGDAPAGGGGHPDVSPLPGVGAVPGVPGAGGMAGAPAAGGVIGARAPATPAATPPATPTGPGGVTGAAPAVPVAADPAAPTGPGWLGTTETEPALPGRVGVPRAPATSAEDGRVVPPVSALQLTATIARPITQDVTCSRLRIIQPRSVR
ncbi:MAG TPA: hypothetical protein VFG30_45280 [Polyangiales bacterium]|nr:hypothetical protein [Polyangiales bacterium]